MRVPYGAWRRDPVAEGDGGSDVSCGLVLGSGVSPELSVPLPGVILLTVSLYLIVLLLLPHDPPVSPGLRQMPRRLRMPLRLRLRLSAPGLQHH
ncbi:unnamed protein product [Ranitomeya imitator]|uniref:Uncharacterized protein n=1 Tax=Ranitomeya imitator TaxID=111125 RepID=A0ABN9MGJ6_9NEOB|nr:unnamed protein product [Ranitomeya imitator]